MQADIAIEWKTAPGEGRVEVINGKLLGGTVARGPGILSDAEFSCSARPCRMELGIDADNMAAGANPTMVGVRAPRNPFTFLLRDVRKESPILMPAYGVAVTTADDKRSFEEIREAVRERRLLTNLQRIDREPEESYEAAAAATRELRCPIWLGISRDVRIFEMDFRQPMIREDWIRPRYHGHGYFWPEPDYVRYRYGYVAGRGWGCTERVRRGLEEGVLPIFRGQRTDDDIRYEHTAFATLERTPLMADAVRGTHFLVADGLSVCHVFTEEQKELFQSLREQELNRDEETVLCCRVVAVNTAAVPRYAFFKAPFPQKENSYPLPYSFDAACGFGMDEESGHVFAVSRLDGNPMPQEEIAVLLSPGEKSVFEFLLPHRPIPRERAAALAKRNVQDCLEQCGRFWKEKLAAAAQMILPEKRIHDMVQAGLLHLDLVTYGLEPDGTLAPSIGTYSAVASESAAVINYLDSVGLHEPARRCIAYYLEKQHEDGFIQNFIGYMLETGAALWLMGEHYRCTRDDAWVEQVRPKILKSCEFILSIRRENQREDLRGRGYGLMEGQVADPTDHERIFMLNGYAYLGLSRAAEMLAKSDPAQSKRLGGEAESLKGDIRSAFFDELARGPVVPLGDGTWCPTAAPWAGTPGPKCLYTDAGTWYTHGAMTLRDDLLGPLYLVFQEVIDPHEQAATFMLNYQTELMGSRNVGFSQPYLSRHPYVHLRRGETRRFLKAYYNTLASSADRETYSFWEHLYHESPHATHSEVQFLMQTRWMLYLEEGTTLKLLRGVPRAWFENGKRIELRKVASYFGPLSLVAASNLDHGSIEAEITCDSDRRPQCVEIRLPHPAGKKPTSVEGGTYNADTETVTIEDFSGRATVRVFFRI